MLSYNITTYISWYIIFTCHTFFTCLGAKYLDYSRHTGLDDTIPILMDEVECSGNEERLIDCGHSRQHGCIHWEDAAVHCKRGGYIQVYRYVSQYLELPISTLEIHLSTICVGWIRCLFKRHSLGTLLSVLLL